MMPPLISVIIPTYNYAGFIVEAVNSVLQQDYPKDKMEIIVVDDGSTDNTKQVLQELIHNGAVRYCYQQNEGKASATGKAIQQAQGKYIFNLDADDYFLAGKLKKTVEVFEADPTIVHIGTPAKQVMPNGSSGMEQLPVDMLNVSLDGSDLLKRFLQNNMLFGGGSTFAARASVLKKIVVLKAVDMFIDEFLIFAVLPFGKSYFIAEHLSVWRVHGGNYSLDADSKKTQLAKSKRLLASSDALLEYLVSHHFDQEVIKIYQLKNLTSHLYFRELAETKTFFDIIHYSKTVFFSIKPGWHIIKGYHVLNRLVPTSILKVIRSAMTTKPV
jgi:glycosyltransferase involved in cell wall biosynthesis